MQLTSSGTSLADRLKALDDVIALARGRVDGEAVEEAERIAGRAGERLRLGDAHTVVALAGATGSGKSSLFNAVVGEPLSQVGMRRPTTGVAHAAVWGGQDAGALLDWLEVPRRHVLGRSVDELDGLVLLDLPDVDSVERRNRLEAERLVERVDMLVWVLDPQKYADAAVHDRYLKPLAGHADVMLVVLNQIDRLSRAARAGCLSDLDRLLRSEGLAGVPVIPASARTGDGLAGFRAELAERVEAKRVFLRRLEADLDVLARELAVTGPGAAVKGAVKGVGRLERRNLVGALSDAAGVGVVTDAVAASYRLRARRSTGWPPTRWMSRLRLDPAKRLRLRDSPSDVVRTSIPGPSAIQRARIDSALRDLSDRASADLPDPWPGLVRGAATSSRGHLPDLLDRAVAGADLGLGRRPRWWRAVGALQLFLVVAAAAGLLWLTGLFVVAWLQLPDPPLPRWGPLPLPTIMLATGLILGVLLAAVSTWFARIGSRRRARVAARRLQERVEQVAQDAVISPVDQELAAHTELREALSRLQS